MNNTTFSRRTCHNGNTNLLQIGSARLMMGGWGTGASFNVNTHVIDLTGREHLSISNPFGDDPLSRAILANVPKRFAGWTSVPFPDYGTPKITTEGWKNITEAIRDTLQRGTDILIACEGGHGRSGIFAAIVCYLLSPGSAEWENPVETIRKKHCQEAVETPEQEEYVYSILNLSFPATRSVSYSLPIYEACPICGTQSTFIHDTGMCLGCKSKYQDKAPLRYDLTVDDISSGRIEHFCNDPRCIGIWQAASCGHIVHNKYVIDGLCETCWEHNQDTQTPAKIDYDKPPTGEACAVCGDLTYYSVRFGICWTCAKDLVEANAVDSVYNTLTDPHREITHSCKEANCFGIAQAETCRHVVHNQIIIAGRCEACRKETE